MGVADRKFGADVSVLTIGGHDLLLRFQSTDVEVSAESIQNSAVKDTSQAIRCKPPGWRVSHTGAVETHTLDNMADHVGTAVVVLITTSVSPAGGGTVYVADNNAGADGTGYGILKSFKHSIGDAQTISLEIEGVGMLGVAAVPAA